MRQVLCLTGNTEQAGLKNPDGTQLFKSNLFESKVGFGCYCLQKGD